MTVEEAIQVLRNRGHIVHDSPARLGEKWFVHFKDKPGEHVMFEKDIIRAAKQEGD